MIIFLGLVFPAGKKKLRNEENISNLSPVQFTIFLVVVQTSRRPSD